MVEMIDFSGDMGWSCRGSASGGGADGLLETGEMSLIEVSLMPATTFSNSASASGSRDSESTVERAEPMTELLSLLEPFPPVVSLSRCALLAI